MRVLALDISKHGTGMAIGDAARPPHSSCRAFPGGTRATTFATFGSWLRDEIVIGKPELIAFERPLVNPMKGKGGNDPETVRLLTGLAAVAEMIAWQRKIRPVDVAVTTWRKFFLGAGFPEDPKEAALIACNRLGWPTGGNHDRAEACGVWAWAHWAHGDRKGIMRQLSESAVRRMVG